MGVGEGGAKGSGGLALRFHNSSCMSGSRPCVAIFEPIYVQVE